MKLIIILTLIIKYSAAAHDQFSFPPQFQKPNPGENSIFLPPEAYTPVPHFQIKNMNNLPYPYLPPTGTKAPTMFPSPFPVILSSTLVPIFDDDESEIENDSIQSNNKIRISSPLPPKSQTKLNNTDSNRIPQPTKRDMRASPKMGNYQHPIDRVDIRIPTQFSLGPTTPNSMTQAAAARNMIIDTHRHDFGIDHIKAASNQNPHYIAAPGFSISSTTEPAIPIIRLSNEMDLDGSFSYEALGADQTHYVQHSHMENMGTDKEEQVVEGSYSYVGDNGQTYTVHYIADSNGFRASGEHLPVGPPIPEIIQRAVQYNLAEEAKKPPHLRDWQENDRESDSNEKGQNYPHPPRNLFTGRTPEAFSYGFSQGSNHDNNLLGASSSQIPIKANSDFIIDHTRSKSNTGPISPQITFVASQGAHVPATNQPTPQQSISRVFGSDKSMPQLVNYEVGHKDTEQDGNRGMWRWQYGVNSNNLSQTPEKNSISRSFGEGDDIMINFGDMTQEQYTKMLQSQFEMQPKEAELEAQSDVYTMNNQNTQSEANYKTQNYPEMNYYSTVTNNVQATTVVPMITSSQKQPQLQNTSPSSNKDTLYVNQNTPYEIRRIKNSQTDYINKPNYYHINSISTQNENKSTYNYWGHKNFNENEYNIITSKPLIYTSTISGPEHFNTAEVKTDFKPIIKPIIEDKQESTTNVVETTTENMFKSNLFLKNLIEPKKPNTQISNKKTIEESKITQNHILDEEKRYSQQKISAESKVNKQPKYFLHPSKPLNDLKTIRNKPTDLTEVINYITNKNMFESSKITPKNNLLNFSGFEQRKEMRSYPYYDRNGEEDFDYNIHQQDGNIRTKSNTAPEREELRGIIKNYKVLQRNNNLHNKSYEQNFYHSSKEQTPSVRMLQSAGLPPLGRAGPSMKPYLPPIYV